MGQSLSASEDKSSILESRNVTVGGRRTSMRLEPQMWDAIETIARLEGMTLNALCGAIDQRRHVGLTSATRVFIVTYFRQLVWSYERGGAKPNGSLLRRALDDVVGHPAKRVPAAPASSRPRGMTVSGED